jgi:hypothetical protein
MKENDIDIDTLLKGLPTAAIQQKLAAAQRTRERLAKELEEFSQELEARRKTGTTGREWPGELEPLVLAAASLLHGQGDIDRIAACVNDFAAQSLNISSVRFALHRLIRRGLIREADRQFTVTPEGERALAKAKETAKRWIQALEARPERNL